MKLFLFVKQFYLLSPYVSISAFNPSNTKVCLCSDELKRNTCKHSKNSHTAALKLSGFYPHNDIGSLLERWLDSHRQLTVV